MGDHTGVTQPVLLKTCIVDFFLLNTSVAAFLPWRETSRCLLPPFENHNLDIIKSLNEVEN